jgi:hypothetical protein
MAININPSRINVGTGTTGRTGTQRQRSEADAEVVVPRRAHLNAVPEPESLATMVRSAVSAMRKGVYWDRGTIVNLMI